MGNQKGLFILFILTLGFILGSAQKTECKAGSADIVFLVDSSASIGDVDFQKAKDFLHTFIMGLDLEADKVKIGVAQFSTVTQQEFLLGEYADINDLLEKIDRLTHLKGGTETGKALSFINNNYFTESAGSRINKYVPQIAVVITDGDATDITVDPAKELRKKGVLIFTIGIGAVSVNGLQSIASKPHQHFVLSFTDYKDLLNATTSALEKVCISITAEEEALAPRFADVFVLVDSSIKVTQKVTQFLELLANQLDVGNTSNKMALAQFGEDISVAFRFNDYSTKNEAIALIHKFQLNATGQANLGKAMDYVRTHLLNTAAGSRIAQGYEQYLVVVSKGESDDNVLASVRKIMDEEVMLVSIDFSKEQGTDPRKPMIAPPDRTIYALTKTSAEIAQSATTVIEKEKQINVTEDCKGAPLADIVFIVDASDNITILNFKRVQNFLHDTISGLQIKGFEFVRVGMVLYGDTPTIDFNLTTFDNKEELLSHSRRLFIRGGESNIGKALEFARQKVFTREKGSRRAIGVQQIAIIITEDDSLDNASVQAMELRRSGVQVYTLGITNDTAQLKRLASYPPHKFVFNVQSFDKLNTMKNVLRNTLCNNIARSADQAITYSVEQGCNQIEEADIYFLIDESSSIGQKEFADMKKFILEFLQRFTIGPNHVRVGVVTYSNDYTLEFELDKYNDKESLKNAVINIYQKYGDTYTGKALKFMTTCFKKANETRGTKVQQILFVITDGEAHDSVKQPAEQLRADDVTIYAIGVKNAINDELIDIAGDQNRMYYVNNFDALKTIKETIFKDICSDKACKKLEMADIIFLVDGSGSIQNDEFSQMKDFMNTIVSKSAVRKDGVQFGVVQFSSSNRVEFALNKFLDKIQMLQAIQEIKQLGGGTNTGSALSILSDYFGPAHGGRSGIPQILIVITDGESQDAVDQPAEALRNKGIIIYSIGVLRANRTQLQEISGNKDNVYMERDFNSLAFLDNEILIKICTSTDDCQKSQVADIVFLVDQSSSIHDDDFDHMKSFMNSVVNSTQVGQDSVRFCTILYSTLPETNFTLNQYYSKREVQDAISKLTQKGGLTFTATAMMYSLDYFKKDKGGRSAQGVPQMLFVITDGEATDSNFFDEATKEVHKYGIDVYGIGVANATRSELEIMTSDKNKVFMVNDFEDLKTLQQNISNVICHNTKPGCEKESADLVMLIDGSGSIAAEHWNTMINFMMSLIDNLRIKDDLFRIGVAQFSSSYRKEFYLKEFHNATTVKTAIHDLKQMKGGTLIGAALNQVQEFFHPSKGSRIQDGISQNLLLITDGQSEDYVIDVAQKLRDNGIEMFVIGIGDISVPELNSIAGSPSRVYIMENFDHFKLNRTTQKIISTVCNQREEEGCNIDIGIGFEISHSSSSSHFYLQTYLPGIISSMSTLRNFCCVPQRSLETNIGFHLVASDGTVLYDTDFEHYNKDIVKKVMGYNKNDKLSFNSQLLNSFQKKFASSNAGVKVVIIFTDGLDASVDDLMVASQDLKNSGVHVLILVALNQNINIIDLQKVQFGRGFGYNYPLIVGKQNMEIQLQKEIDAVSTQECCNVMCKCIGHEGMQGPQGPTGEKGLPGWRGAPGFPGEDGEHGERGPPGLNGNLGSPGCNGRRGEKGNIGHSGNTGGNGERGFDGINGEQGATGLAGYPGEAGNPGSHGKKGNQGVPGEPGQKGLRGDQGDTGIDNNNRGPKGEAGYPGIEGDPGPDGSKGGPGDTGSPGQKGKRGTVGVLGTPGPPGEQGLRGTPGASGPKGPLGPPGGLGEKGMSGFPGLQGPPGIEGKIGSKGSTGLRGQKGQAGEPGINGAKGPLGHMGPPGNDGPDGYGLPGPKGRKGDPGIIGYPGQPGENGEPGKNGYDGLKGKRGRAGNAGRPGLVGNPGDPGSHGPRGPKGPSGINKMSTCELISYVRKNCVCCKDKAACPVYPTELVIGLDMSDDVSPAVFQRMRSTLLSLLDNIEIAENNCPTGTRVSVVSYNSNTKYLIRFSDYHRKKDLVEAVKNIPLERTINKRSIGAAMRFVGRNVFKRIRQGVLIRKVALFLSGGPSQDRTSLTTAVLEYKARDINLGVIGFKSTPDVQNAFQADQTGSFIYVLESLQSQDAACEKIQRCVICYDPCNPDRDCHSTTEVSALEQVDMDLALLVDGSRSIPADQYEAVKHVLSTVLDQFVVSGQPSKFDKQARVAFYQQSSSYSEAQAPVKQIFSFQQFQDRSLMKQSIFENLQQTGGSSRLGQAMEFIIMQGLLTVPRARKNKMVLLILGGETELSERAKLDFISMKAKCQGVVIFILTVGDHFNSVQLEKLASSPTEQHIVHLGHVKQGEQEYIRRFMRTFLHMLKRGMNTYPTPLLRNKCKNLQEEHASAATKWPPIYRASSTVIDTEDTEGRVQLNDKGKLYAEQTGTKDTEYKYGDLLPSGYEHLNVQCLLPMDSGTVCEKFGQSWYYNSVRGECVFFWYGGCDGNNNRFSTKMECYRTCVTTDVCHLKKDTGPCKNYVIKWFYNHNGNKCFRFLYGGCDGNLNRFETQKECESHCVQNHPTH